MSTLINISYFFVIIYLILKPFYFWSSGLPQVSDFFLLVLCIIWIFKSLISPNKNKEGRRVIFYCSIYIGYVLIINFIWYMFIGVDTTLLFSNLFYLYNFFVFLTFVIFISNHDNNQFYKILYYGINSSLLIQLLLILFTGNSGGRATNFFQNPNQLAYYGLLCLCLLFVLYKRVKVNHIVFGISCVIASYLIIISLSQAGFAGFIFAVVLFVISTKINLKYKIAFLLLTIILVVFTYLFIKDNSIFWGISPLLDSIIIRYNGANLSGEGFITERGYDRILLHPEHWIFGAGEGVYNRFKSVAKYEMHSTLGTIFMSYGIIGLSLFCIFIMQINKNNKFLDLYPIVSILVYGLTHNGIRNSLLWILFAVIFSLNTRNSEDKERNIEKDLIESEEVAHAT